MSGTNRTEAIIHRHLGRPGALLPILHEIQAAFGYIPSESLPGIAGALKLSRAEVHGVVSFYHEFRTQPPGHHIVQICRAEACQAMGGRDLEEHAKDALAIGYGDTTADGRLTLEPVYCLGNCACSPSIRIDDHIHARVDSDRFDRLIASLENRELEDGENVQ